MFQPERFADDEIHFLISVLVRIAFADDREVQNQVNELKKTNMYGTPTIFIKDKAFVGPKPYRVYRSAINKFIFF